jgi:hypothetical protein
MDEAPLRDFHSAAQRITRIEMGGKLSIEEIREAYGEIIRAYNEIFPLHPRTRKLSLDEENDLCWGDSAELFRLSVNRKAMDKLRQSANESGNPVIWNRGDPLDGLPEGVRKRIEKAIKFGI